MADARLDALVGAARAARERAYAPYSGFAVGAAALARRADLHRGQRRERELPGVGLRRTQCGRRDDRRRRTPLGRHRRRHRRRRHRRRRAGPAGRCCGSSDRARSWCPRRSPATAWSGRSRTSCRRPSSGDRGELAGGVPQRHRRRGRTPERREVDPGQRARRPEGRDRVEQAADHPARHPRDLEHRGRPDRVHRHARLPQAQDAARRAAERSGGRRRRRRRSRDPGRRRRRGDRHRRRLRLPREGGDRRRARDLCREQGRRGAEARRAAAAPGRRRARHVRGDRSRCPRSSARASGCCAT